MLRFGLLTSIAAIGFLAISCTAKKSDPAPASVAAASPVRLPPERAESASPRAVKRGDLLVVTLDGGKRVELHDERFDRAKENVDTVRVHRYKGYEPAIRQHVIEIGHWEGREFMLLDDRTAARNSACGPPVVSPSGQRFACADADFAYGSPRIEIWRVTPGGIEKEFSSAMDRPPRAITWLGEDRLRVVLHHYDDSEWARLVYGLAGSTWRLEARCGGIGQAEEDRPPETRMSDGTPPGCEQGEQPVR